MDKRAITWCSYLRKVLTQSCKNLQDKNNKLHIDSYTIYTRNKLLPLFLARNHVTRLVPYEHAKMAAMSYPCLLLIYGLSRHKQSHLSNEITCFALCLCAFKVFTLKFEA